MPFYLTNMKMKCLEKNTQKGIKTENPFFKVIKRPQPLTFTNPLNVPSLVFSV
jgi:hypothetical protein